MTAHGLPTTTHPHHHHHPAQAFAQTLQQSRGFGTDFRFPDAVPGAGTGAAAGGLAGAGGFGAGTQSAAAVDEEDDLYS
eukprot:24199-Chlamydomonas_euryale.AAC.2